MLDFLHAHFDALAHPGLQVVQVVEMYPRQGGDSRINVTWERDVDQQQWTSCTLFHDPLHEIAGDNGVGSAGRTEYHVGLYQGVGKFSKRAMLRSETLRQVDSVILGAIHDAEPPRAIITRRYGRAVR